MPAPTTGFVAQTEGVVASATAGTAKTVLSCIAAAAGIVLVSELGIQFDGVTATEKPILVELCRSTQATAGTSTAVTLRQVRGNPGASANATAAKNYTAEPTVVTPVREWLIDPYKGLFVVQFPLGREIESTLAGGLTLRCTVPTGGAAVNIRAYMEIE